MPITEYNAEAFFSIDAHGEREAVETLARATHACNEALRKLNDELPNGTRVDLALEDEHGSVEVS